jgi:predicted O-methyltransferase YrrM
MASRIFLTAVELDVFGLLDTQALTSAEMASRISADERATEILLNALAGMKLLEKRGDKFTITRTLGELLRPGSPKYLGAYDYNVHLWEAWSHLTEVVKSGRPFNFGRTDESKRDFALYLNRYSKSTASVLARFVDLSDVYYLLDLGGGTGAYAIAIARQYHQISVMLFDRNKEALELAGEEIAREGLKDRINLKCGDFFVDDLGQGYDLILLSSVMCLFKERQNLRLLQRVWTSLLAGGKIVILDSIVDSSHTRPTAAAMFAVNMLITSHSGQSHSYDHVKGWLNKVGFEHTRRIPMKGSQIIMAEKGKERD